MNAAIWTTALALTMTQIGPMKGLPEPDQPKLLVKEKDYFVHALPPIDAGQRLPARLRGMMESSSSGVALLHTAVATGEMKRIWYSHVSVMEMPYTNSGTPLISETFIAGFAADRERLYVLDWSTSNMRTTSTAGTFHLVVFRAADGKRLHVLKLEGDKAPDKQPEQTTDRGPLRLHEGGVTCFGIRFDFKGAELLKPSAEKKP